MILYDSAKFRRKKLKANEEHFSKHDPAEPLYTESEVDAVIPKFRVVDKDLDIKLDDDISFKFFYASHILGACSIELTIDGKVLFSRRYWSR